jgi:hypothetical protein
VWYGTWIDQRGSEVLGRSECARLLAVRSDGVGHLGIVVDGQPVVVPLNYRMIDGDVVLRIGPGTILSTIRQGDAIVAFEVDHTPEGHDSQWWSVLVRGLGLAIRSSPPDPCLYGRAPTPAVPEPGQAVVRIRTELLTGRRFWPDAGKATAAG